ncbi:hypothetical protein DCAR_0933412 [Daucus carota subsp. sativus]|uniref:Uncharacterized protein n=1 Tax=Daucus carota subsp. sativus TaxID=79200 RepID=A0A175YDD9_DAUCS|nr:hypothetical protein DCAR_0933412 [Daucus carota subsp. sativus]
MENTPSPSTMVSPHKDKPHILDLNKDDGDEYSKFIKSIIDEFESLKESGKLCGTQKSGTLQISIPKSKIDDNAECKDDKGGDR